MRRKWLQKDFFAFGGEATLCDVENTGLSPVRATNISVLSSLRLDPKILDGQGDSPSSHISWNRPGLVHYVDPLGSGLRFPRSWRAKPLFKLLVDLGGEVVESASRTQVEPPWPTWPLGAGRRQSRYLSQAPAPAAQRPKGRALGESSRWAGKEISFQLARTNWDFFRLKFFWRKPRLPLSKYNLGPVDSQILDVWISRYLDRNWSSRRGPGRAWTNRL